MTTGQYIRGEVLLSIEGVSQRYGEVEVLNDINVQVRNLQCSQNSHTAGQVVAFLGPSGSGKTQLLRIIAGLQAPTAGAVYIDPDRKPVQRGMAGVVFQKYPLFAHRTVLDNLMVAGAMAGLDAQASRRQSEEYLTLFGLEAHAHKYPIQLSGGQQQRVAISQQLVNLAGKSPLYTKLILMDEPFASLDPRIVNKTCKLIRNVADISDTTTVIVVTHDVRAALAIADIVWIMGKYEVDGVRRGSRIVAELDLVEEGLTWHPEIYKQPRFAKLEEEISEMFEIL